MKKFEFQCHPSVPISAKVAGKEIDLIRKHLLSKETPLQALC